MELNKQKGITWFVSAIKEYIDYEIPEGWTVELFSNNYETATSRIEFEFQGPEGGKEILFALSFNDADNSRTLHYDPLFERKFPKACENILNAFHSLNFNMRII